MLRGLLMSVLAAAAALPMLAHVQLTQASRFKVFTVEVSEAGFNPATCQISRDNYVQFKNVGRTSIRVLRNGSAGGLTFDSGDLKPGQVSNQDYFPHGGSAIFYDAARPNNHLTVVLPVFSPEWEEFCDPKPGAAPLPAFSCDSAQRCAVLPALASDR